MSLTAGRNRNGSSVGLMHPENVVQTCLHMQHYNLQPAIKTKQNNQNQQKTQTNKNHQTKQPTQQKPKKGSLKLSAIYRKEDIFNIPSALLS